MTTRIVALLFVFLMSAGAAAQTVTFGETASFEGVTRTHSEGMVMDLDIMAEGEGGPQSMKMYQSERNTYTETVHSYVDGRVMRRTVVFAEAVKESTQPMRGKKKTEPPIVGITYEITATDPDDPAKLDIVREDGDDVAEEAASYLTEKFDAKERMRLDEVLSGRTMSVGETFSLNDDQMKGFGNSIATDKMTVQSVTLTLNGVSETDGEQVAELGIAASFAQASPIMELEITMKGTVQIFTESLWPLNMELDGSIVGAGSHGGSTVTADGMVTMSRKASYE